MNKSGTIAWVKLAGVVLLGSLIGTLAFHLSARGQVTEAAVYADCPPDSLLLTTEIKEWELELPDMPAVTITADNPMPDTTLVWFTFGGLPECQIIFDCWYLDNDEMECRPVSRMKCKR